MLPYPCFIPKILAGRNKHLFVYSDLIFKAIFAKKVEAILKGNIVEYIILWNITRNLKILKTNYDIFKSM